MCSLGDYMLGEVGRGRLITIGPCQHYLPCLPYGSVNHRAQVSITGGDLRCLTNTTIPVRALRIPE